MSKSLFARTPAWAYAAALFLVGLGLGLTGKSLGLNRGPLGAALMTTVVLAVIAPVSVLYWRRLDEAAREAHKFAWYWGGSAGILVVLVAFVAISAPEAGPLPAGLLGEDPREIFGRGMLATLSAQIAGYTVAWAGWWIARR